MARDVGIGFTLQPEERYLELCGSLIREETDYFEIAPETTWRPDPGRPGALRPNGFHGTFARLGEETGRPFVAHGVGFSVGTARRDPERDARWLERSAADHALFAFRWYTDHLGVTQADGYELTLPLPVPMTPEAAAVVRGALATLQSVVEDVGFENSAFYYHLGDPLAEPGWIARALDRPRTHLLLDLHNLHTNAVNAGFEEERYLQGLPLERVIEIHLSGGGTSEPRWLPSGRALRLDSHDAAVPERVWELFEHVLPRCTGLRGVTLERMEGTVEDADVPLLREELRRARRTVEVVGVG